MVGFLRDRVWRERDVELKWSLSFPSFTLQSQGLQNFRRQPPESLLQ